MSEKRSIFEEVSDEKPVDQPKGGVIDGAKRGARRGIRMWLVALFALVALMIVIGGFCLLYTSDAADE